MVNDIQSHRSPVAKAGWVASLLPEEGLVLQALAAADAEIGLAELRGMVGKVGGAGLVGQLEALLSSLIRRGLVERPGLREQCFRLRSQADAEVLTSGLVSRLQLQLHLVRAEQLARDPEGVRKHLDLLRHGIKSSATLSARDPEARDGPASLEAPTAAERRALHLSASSVALEAGELRDALLHLFWARQGQSRGARLAIYARAAVVYLAAGRLRASERMCRRVLGPRQLPDAEDEAAVSAYMTLTEVHLGNGARSEAHALALAGLGVLSANSPAALLLRDVLARCALEDRAIGEARALATEVEVQARQRHLARALARSKLTEGRVAALQSRLTEAKACFELAIELSDAPWERADANEELGMLHLSALQFEKALLHLRRALALNERMARAQSKARLESRLARFWLILGCLDEARELTANALLGGRSLGDPRLRTDTLLLGGELALRSQQPVVALEHYQQAVRVAERASDLESLREALLGTIRAQLRAGNLTAAGVAGAQVRKLPAVSGPGIEFRQQLALAELALESGASAEATSHLEKALAQLHGGVPLLEAHRAYVLYARLHRLEGRDAEGRHASQVAERVLRDTVSRLPAAVRVGFLREAEMEVGAGLTGLIGGPLPRGGLSDGQPAGLAGKSSAARRLCGALERVAAFDTHVALHADPAGDAVGLASWIHARSSRASQPYVVLDCDAVPPDLLLSALVGREFPSGPAWARREIGALEKADGGTLFIQEVSRLDAAAQRALLQVIAGRSFSRLGGNQELQASVRIICSTSVTLLATVERRAFAAEFLSKLGAVALEVPPLRRRLQDIPEVCEQLLCEISAAFGDPQRAVTKDAVSLLQRHTWPGGIEELRTALRTAVLITPQGELSAHSFERIPALGTLLQSLGPTGTVVEENRVDWYALMRSRDESLGQLWEEVERGCIGGALLESKGVISDAARLLGMKRSRLSQVVNASTELRELSGRLRRSRSAE